MQTVGVGRVGQMELRRVFDDLVRFETVLWNSIDARLVRDCGISLGILNLMMVIDPTPQCRVQDVADALAITVGGASQAVDRLEAAGWSQRRPNPADRRSSLLELTDTGQAMLLRAGAVFDEELQRLLQVPLSPTLLKQFATALGAVRRAAFSSGPVPTRR
jgi:DNA-binding MarR family transcriptional regulator